MKKVNFIVESPLNKRDITRYGYNHFDDITIIDIGYMTKQNMYNEYIPPDSCNHNKYYIIKTIQSFKTLFEKEIDNNEIVFLLIGHDNNKGLEILKFISSKNVVWGSLSLTAVATHTVKSKKNKIELFLSRIKSITYCKLKHYILKKITFKFNIRKFDFYIIGSNVNIFQMYNTDVNTKIIKVHSLDYNHYLNYLPQQKKLESQNTIVYLDGFFPFHPDFLFMDVDYHQEIVEKFFKQMNNFFDLIELKYNVEVKIASHPRADWSKYGDVWNGRKVEYDKTVELVNESKACIAFSSTAINFAVLLNKPIILFNMEVLEPRYGEIIRHFSKLLGTDIVDISVTNEINEEKIDKCFDFNNLSYAKYIEDYIKFKESPNKNLWLTVKEELNK